MKKINIVIIMGYSSGKVCKLSWYVQYKYAEKKQFRIRIESEKRYVTMLS